jgi:hypothetical protein
MSIFRQVPASKEILVNFGMDNNSITIVNDGTDTLPKIGQG